MSRLPADPCLDSVQVPGVASGLQVVDGAGVVWLRSPWEKPSPVGRGTTDVWSLWRGREEEKWDSGGSQRDSWAGPHLSGR